MRPPRKASISPPETEAKIMIASNLPSCATPQCTDAAVHGGAETIHLDAARVRHISR